MKKYFICYILFFVPLLAQNLPISWTQSYCTYDLAETHDVGKYSLGFGIDNYCIYSPNADTIAYDERRFDIFTKFGLLRKTELEVKYSYPTAGIVALKYQFLDDFVCAAFKFGLGYMKGTRVGLITDYVFDFYPTFIFSKSLNKNFRFYIAPKIIYSIHTRDRQEHSQREPQSIFHYGCGFGLAIGTRFMVSPESNWLFGNNAGVKYIVHQFGLGVNLRIH